MNAGERIRATYSFQPVDHMVRRDFYIPADALTQPHGPCGETIVTAPVRAAFIALMLGAFTGRAFHQG